MFWKFIKVLFDDPKDPEPVVEEPAETPVFTEEQPTPIETPPPPKPKAKPAPQAKPINKPKIPAIIEEDQQSKEHDMAEIYLVVIDTTGRVEAKNFPPAIQNFYFIFAQDEEQAKGIVLHTFRSRPALVAQLQYSVKATKLAAITRGIGPGSNFWTYVPFGNQRQPGQQGIMPSPDKLLKPNQYGEASSQTYIPQAPVGGEQITPDDLKGVQFDAADARVINKLRPQNAAPIPEEAAPLTPEQEAIAQLVEQNKAMMAKMEAMMSASAAPAPAKRVRTKTGPAPAAPTDVPTGPAAPTE
jgi:hypothetical protein